MNSKRILIILILVSALLFLSLSTPTVAPATTSNWLNGWSNRQSHVLSASAGAGTNYQMRVHVIYTGTASIGEDILCNSLTQADFDDIRFTDDDGVTLLDYWLESKTDANNAIFWVEIADSLEASTQTIYVYYGNAGALSTSDGDKTFPFFDDFSGILTTKWDLYGSGTASTSSGILTVPVALPLNTGGVRSKTSFGIGYSVRASVKLTGYGEFAWSEYSGGLINNYFLIHTDGASLWRSSVRKDGGNSESYLGPAFDANYHIWENQRISTNLNRVVKDDLNFHDHTNSVNNPTANLPANFYSANAGSSLSVDWVLVRKIVQPEPVHSTWGAVETLNTPATSATVTVTPNTSSTSDPSPTASSIPSTPEPIDYGLTPIIIIAVVLLASTILVFRARAMRRINRKYIVGLIIIASIVLFCVFQSQILSLIVQPKEVRVYQFSPVADKFGSHYYYFSYTPQRVYFFGYEEQIALTVRRDDYNFVTNISPTVGVSSQYRGIEIKITAIYNTYCTIEVKTISLWG